MKKKLTIFIAVLSLLALMVVSLVACSRATTQGQLANFLVDHGQEVFVYDVKNAATNETGTYTVTVTKHAANSAIDCPYPIANVEAGVLVESHLVMGSVEYQTGCYFNIVSGTSLMTPAYTYRIQKENGNETFRMKGNYTGAVFKFEKVIDGKVSTGAFKLSGTYFDNNEFHQSLRTVTTFSTNFNFSYSVPLVSPNESSAVTLSASCSRTAKVKTAYTATLADAEDGVECYNVHVARSTKVAGLAQSLYYAKNPMKAGNSTLTMTHVLVKFYEPYITESGEKSEIEYALKTAEIH